MHICGGFCEWCKYLSEKSLCWAANYPLISSTLRTRANNFSSKEELAKFGNALEKHCSCGCTCQADKKIMLLSEIQLSFVLVTVLFTAYFSLKDLLTVFWCAAVTSTNWWWCHGAVQSASFQSSTIPMIKLTLNINVCASLMSRERCRSVLHFNSWLRL